MALFDFNLTIDLTDRLYDLLQRIAEALRPQPVFTVTGGDLQGEIFMIIVPNDQADERFSITPVTATDAEGEPVAITETLESTDGNVVSVMLDTAGDVHAGALHFGRSGVATINYVVKTKVGKEVRILKSAAVNFTVTTGAPGEVLGGDLTLATLVDEPEPTPEPVPEGN